MDDYYELLDVAPDAARDDIRAAYRALRDQLVSQDGEQNRAEVAKLNRAWNVLSDPIQRERYDERLAEYREEGDDDDYYEDDDDDDDDDDDEAAARRPVARGRKAAPLTRAEQRAEARRARANRQPTIELPDGLTFAATKSRLAALGFDLALLLIIFTVSWQFIGVKIVNDRYPRQTDRINAISDSIDVIDKNISADSKQADAADKQAEAAATRNDDAAEATAKRKAADARAARDSEKKKRDRLVKESRKLSEELKPASTVAFAGIMAVAFLYLVPSTALSGQTLGKRLRRIRVVRLDGSLPGWATASRRFGFPLLLAVALFPFLGPLGLAVLVLGTIGWVSHPNRQGLHDRLAKTVVVEA